jgi:hypothetical protein
MVGRCCTLSLVLVMVKKLVALGLLIFLIFSLLMCFISATPANASVLQPTATSAIEGIPSEMLIGDMPSAEASSGFRRVADNIYAMQTFKDVLELSRSHCVTGIEKMGIANGPLYVWVVPKKHQACRNVPSAPLNLPAIDSKSSISYLGYGFFKFESLDEDLPLIASEYEVLDTEAIADGYVAIVRKRNRNWA